MRLTKSSATLGVCLGVAALVSFGAGAAQEPGREAIWLPIGDTVTVRHSGGVPSFVTGKLVGQDQDWLLILAENGHRTWVSRPQILTLERTVPDSDPVRAPAKK